MAGKCPMCGAPLDNSKCGYCGYTVTVAAPQTAPTLSESPVTQTEIHTASPIVMQVSASPAITYGVSQKSKTITLLLCIFLGYLGVHKFYVGKIGGGLLYLLTGGLFGLGWLIDIIVIATGHFQDGFGLAILE